MTVKKAKTALTMLWVIVTMPLLLLLIMRQLNGFYGTDAKAVWTWAAQYLFPPLTLIGSAWAVAQTPGEGKRIAAPIVFWVAIVMSLAYLCALLLVAGAQAGEGQSWQSVFEQSGLFLSLFQALLIGWLGKFFIESRR